MTISVEAGAGSAGAIGPDEVISYGLLIDLIREG